MRARSVLWLRHDVRTGSRRPRSSNRSLAQPEKGRVTAVDSSPQYSIPNSTLAAPSKSDHRQYCGVQDYVFVQHHVAAVLPMIPKDSSGTSRGLHRSESRELNVYAAEDRLRRDGRDDGRPGRHADDRPPRRHSAADRLAVRVFVDRARREGVLRLRRLEGRRQRPADRLHGPWTTSPTRRRPPS